APHPRTDIVLDLLTILDQVTKRRPELTKKGTLPKKLSEQWASMITLDESICRQVLERKQATTFYPPKTAIAIDLLQRSGWMKVSEGKLVPLTSRLRSWMNAPDQHWESFVYRLWIEVFTPASPLARTLGYIWPNLPEGDWLGEESILLWWRNIRSL